mmetsp:Transcript_35703/g.115787  ORF Transcript_35703/g.115787 Transcript_35703/m.115787 type:complete len:240 (-) Transcript_35703:1131-1850(-)
MGSSAALEQRRSRRCRTRPPANIEEPVHSVRRARRRPALGAPAEAASALEAARGEGGSGERCGGGRQRRGRGGDRRGDRLERGLERSRGAGHRIRGGRDRLARREALEQPPERRHVLRGAARGLVGGQRVAEARGVAGDEGAGGQVVSFIAQGGCALGLIACLFVDICIQGHPQTALEILSCSPPVQIRAQGLAGNLDGTSCRRPLPDELAPVGGRPEAPRVEVQGLDLVAGFFQQRLR